VDLVGAHRTLRGREAEGEERERLWALFREYSQGSDLDAYARLRSRSTPVVVLEPAAHGTADAARA
jgi:hypothetical protein